MGNASSFFFCKENNLFCVHTWGFFVCFGLGWLGFFLIPNGTWANTRVLSGHFHWTIYETLHQAFTAWDNDSAPAYSIEQFCHCRYTRPFLYFLCALNSSIQTEKSHKPAAFLCWLMCLFFTQVEGIQSFLEEPHIHMPSDSFWIFPTLTLCKLLLATQHESF